MSVVSPDDLRKNLRELDPGWPGNYLSGAMSNKKPITQENREVRRPGHPRHVLAVDDEYTSLQVLRHTLTKAGHSVEAHVDPNQALEALKQEDFDFVLSDYFMPAMNGDEFLNQVRRIRPNIPIVFLTVSEETGVAVRLLKAGADDFLTKPVDPHELMFRIEKAIENKERERQLRRVEQEQALRALEERSIVNWRLLYGSKDIAQTKEIVQRLSRSINQGGGFLWLDLLQDSAVRADDETVTIPAAVYDMILETGKTQKNVFDQVTFVASVAETEVETDEIDVETIVQELSGLAQSTLDGLTLSKKQEYRIHKNTRDAALTIAVEPELYKKILNELLVNAVKYSTERSRIDVWFNDAIRNGTPGLELVVWNDARPLAEGAAGEPDALGVPYEYSERVFDLFFTIDHFPNIIEGEEWQDGTGLYVVRELAKHFGGWAECRNITHTSVSPPRIMVETKVFVPYLGQ